MIIAISGSSGFIGKQLSAFFREQGNEIRFISRISSDTSVDVLAVFLANVNVVINLAGAPVVGRWTKHYKEILLSSRINTTRKIVEAIHLMDIKPELLISASAVGIYSQDKGNTESDFKIADNYLGSICHQWEAEAQKAAPLSRVVIMRLGIVLGENGGALKQMLPLFKLGLGGKIVSGRQGFSWIHITDVIRATEHVITHKKLEGEFNFTAPEVLDNYEFTKLLANTLKRPALFAVPAFILKLLFGEGSVAIMEGQFASPKRLLEAGFIFAYPDLKSALNNILNNSFDQ